MAENSAPMPLHVLITGGKGDLARALEAEFIREGHHVNAPGRQTLDVTDEKQIDAYFSSLVRIDVLIANAGLTRDSLLANMSPGEFDQVINTNLRGAFLCARAAVKLMVKQCSGHLLFMGSRSAKHGPRGHSNYGAAKAGLIGLAQSLAQEYGSRNIRCNIVLPGFLETRMTASVRPERREEIRTEHVLGRFNTVENAARAVAFLAQLDHVSGQVFTLDSRLDRWT
ncbi:MAG TPA: SDR family oxidoreductase [Candidatus Methylacidiphilales bacterium]|nr:SDR family oxidoreductase [Candidatus Methylacidiphilales bacterium]